MTESLSRPIAALAGLWALGITQPLLDALRRAPEFFVAHRADASDAILVAAVLTFAGPVILAAVVLAARAMHETLVGPVAAALVGVLGAIVVVQVAYRLGVNGWVGSSVVTILAIGAFAVAWLRLRAFRMFVLVLSPAAIVVPVVFLLSALPAVSSGSAGQTAAAAPLRMTPVVVIVFDELSSVSLMDRAGRINSSRYPNLSALAADGVWYRNATAVSDYTRWALPPILTGRYPVSGSTPTPSHHPDTLFSLLSRSHRLEVVEQVTSLCPRQLCDDTPAPRWDRWRAMAGDLSVVTAHLILPPAARGDLPDLTANWANFDDGPDAGDDRLGDSDEMSGPRVIRPVRNWREHWRRAIRADDLAIAEAFVNRISPDDAQPSLYFLHTLVSHHPTRWLPSGQRIANRQQLAGLRNETLPDAGVGGRAAPARGYSPGHGR